MAKRGRPSSFTPERGRAICELLAEGKSLLAICKKPGMPAPYTVSRWLADPANTEFQAEYARARDVGLDLLADEIMQIANTPKKGKTTKKSEDGVEVTEGDMLGHRRLQVDARKWYLSKLAPRRYGDRLELSGSVVFDRASALRRAREARGAPPTEPAPSEAAPAESTPMAAADHEDDED